MDFYRISVREIEKGSRKGEMEVYPDFLIKRSKDLMIRGKAFYAIWDEAQGLWSTDEYDVQRLVDEDLDRFVSEKTKSSGGAPFHIRYMSTASSQTWFQFKRYVQHLSDNSQNLDNDLVFSNTETKKTDHASHRLPYPLAAGDISAWDELIGTLYSVEERTKIEWAIGSIVSGDAKKIQKFLVLYGPAGTGKSTILNIVEKLFTGYTTTFEAKALGSSNGSFATEVFKNNPLVAIQHDGDLSRIEDNTRLNSIISHEEMTMNEKYKPSYTSRVNAFLFMGTNQPVKISDAKSGIIRRLIDVHPTGVRIPANHYNTLLSQVDFELGAIAHHCLEVYRELGKNHYNAYRPLEMMLQTDVFFNYIEAHFDIFKEQDGTSLKQAYQLYKEYCADTGIEKVLPQYKIREELRNYFDNFQDRGEINGVAMRSVYSGFNATKFKTPAETVNTFSLVLEETESIFDDMAAGWAAQYEVEDKETNQHRPQYKWVNVKTALEDLDTSKVHYVRVPENHIVIDFDLADETGAKSLERNLEAASVWPATYAELSKSGAGVHLHYNYEGDVSELAASYSDGIEVKTLLGDAALRRRLSVCNNVPVATLNGGLPLKEKKMMDVKTIRSEKGLRDMIARNLHKEFHPGTKPSIDFIKKILEDAYNDGLNYDVSDLRAQIIAFASNSTNQALVALKTVQEMKFQGPNVDRGELFADEDIKPDDAFIFERQSNDDRLAFFDVEVYPNLFIICWKFDGSDDVVRMRNPSAQDVEQLMKLRLVGFNNRRYDNHILYARFMGYDNMQLYKLSKKIISGDSSALFGAAYGISYSDIYEFSSKKQSLKKFMIDLGLNHMEMDIPWDDEVPEDVIPKVEQYCVNDVLGTEATFHNRKQDFVARQILADLSGLSVNDTTQKHTARIIFGKDRNPQASFKYTDLSKEFPGYTFDSSKTLAQGKSSYLGENPSEGGYVYAEPGMYQNVEVFDVASMHPTSIVQLNLFGDYTPNFEALLKARLAIKHRDYDAARKMLNGKLSPHLGSTADADALSYALKIIINIVYGLTSAKFDNPFRDRRNKDNIVAKRGALFMVKLKKELQDMGATVVHIKTDSVKVVEPTQEIRDFIFSFGEKYGYTFEVESIYDKFCLVNDAVYIAREGDKWEAVGAQFQHPYVYKTLFTHEELTFDDHCETKQVSKGAMYLDFEYDTPMITAKEGMKFVGRTGRFTPVEEGQNGAMLYRVDGEKTHSVAGTKGYLWLESDMAKESNAKISIDYFETLADKAVSVINKFGDFNEFVK